MSAAPGRPTKPPKTKSRLEQLISQYAESASMPAGRVRNWVSFMVFAGAIERAVLPDGSPAFWFKGGLTMEARFGTPARATKDVDAIFRLGVDDEALLATLDEALTDEYHGFTFAVDPPTQVKDTIYRLARVRLAFNGRTWGSVKLEISPPEGSATRPDMVSALPLDFAGLQGPSMLPCLPVSFQIAQKLHAVTERFDLPRQNERERDLIDLLLLRELADDLAVVRGAAIEIFDSRMKHAWPPQLNAEPNWIVDYPAVAREFKFPFEDLDEALSQVRAFVSEIDAAVLDPPPVADDASA